MIKIFCDRCGEEITKCKSHGYISMNTRDIKDESLVEDNEFENNHYCNSCMKQIRKFIIAVPVKSDPPIGTVMKPIKKQDRPKL